jgi:hypothetical protein
VWQARQRLPVKYISRDLSRKPPQCGSSACHQDGTASRKPPQRGRAADIPALSQASAVWQALPPMCENRLFAYYPLPNLRRLAALLLLAQTGAVLSQASRAWQRLPLGTAAVLDEPPAASHKPPPRGSACHLTLKLLSSFPRVTLASLRSVAGAAAW